MKRTPLFLAGLFSLAAVATACGSGSSDTSPSTTSPPPSTTQAPTTTAPTTTQPGVTVPGNATSTVNVWFLDSNHARTGEEPLFRPVQRSVTPPALASAALNEMFAGPTATEKADGLELILSGATGYSNLHIENGIAYVKLEGGCSSGGSTMTIAGEIMPTLRQFASVDYVKIFDPSGTTETPTGASDSIPTCLEP